MRFGQFQACEEGENPRRLVDRHTRPVDQIGQGEQYFESVFALSIANAVHGRKVGRIRLIENPVVDIPCIAVNQPPHELLATQHAFLAIRAVPVEINRLRGEITFCILWPSARRFLARTFPPLLLLVPVHAEVTQFDLLIDQCLLVEVKACESIHPIHKAQLLSYMKLLDIPLGLIINFNELKLADGISRLILPGANME